MVAVGGMERRLNAKDVENETRLNGLFHDLVFEYSHALLITILRTGACNVIHSLANASHSSCNHTGVFGRIAGMQSFSDNRYLGRELLTVNRDPGDTTAEEIAACTNLRLIIRLSSILPNFCCTR
jgi:hypothetical protein